MDFSNLNNTQLNALLETASPEDCKTIRAIIESRTTPEKSVKISDAKRKEIANDLRAKYVGCTCQVLPYDSAEWKNGKITSIVEDPNSQDIFFSILTSDNHRVFKSRNSKEIHIDPKDFEAHPEPEPKPDKGENWDAKKEVEKHLDCVGKLLMLHLVSEEGTEDVFGRVYSIVSNRPCKSIILRLHVPRPTEDNPKAFQLVSRVYNDSLILIDDDRSEALRILYTARKQRRQARDTMSPAAKVRLCEENLKKAEANLLKAQDVIRVRKQQLIDAKQELEISLITE